MIAKYYIIVRALEDKTLSHQEVDEILGVVFDESRPLSQVDTQSYSYLKESFVASQKAATKDPKMTIQYEDKTDQQKMAYLLGSFPGNLEHYQTVLAKNGLGVIDPAENLPEVTLNLFERDVNQPEIFHFDFDLDSTNYIFDVDTREPLNKQKFIKDDPLNRAILTDVMMTLQNLYQTSALSAEEQQSFTDYLNYTVPYLEPPKSYLGKIQGPNTNLLMDDFSAQHVQPIQSNFPIPMVTDTSIDAIKVNAVISQVRTIIGDEILSELKGFGVAIGFFDFATLFENRQGEHLLRDRAILDPLSDAAGFYETESHSIWLDTNRPINLMVYALIHEIGHAFNFYLQEKSHAAIKEIKGSDDTYLVGSETGYEIEGMQQEMFLQLLQERDYGYYFPSGYGMSNHAEWFAEVFTQYMLERAGRFDLLKERIDYNDDSLKSFFTVDCYAYLMMDKLVSTVKNRQQDPVSYQALLSRGLDWNFFMGVTNYYGEHNKKYSAQAVYDERSAQPEVPSPTLEALLTDWRQTPLSQLYQTETEPSNFDEFVKSELAFYTTHRVKNNPYLPDKKGHYQMRDYVEHVTDFKAIQIICELKYRAKMREEKIDVLLKQGLTSEAQLQLFYDSFQALTAEEVEPYLNQDDLISEAWLTYQQKLGEEELKMR